VTRTYQELRDAVLTYLQVPTGSESEFMRGTTDMILVAANNAMRSGQKRHDFNFLAGSVQVSVDPDTGADWTSLTSIGTKLRRIETVFRVQTAGLSPIRWTTRQTLANEILRSNDRSVSREWYPTDATEYVTETMALVEGNKIYLHPKPDAATTLEIQGYTWLNDLSDSLTDGLLSDTNFMLEYGFDWVMWQTLVELNYYTKQFVARQEGNLPPPTQMAERAWLDLVQWDDTLFEKQMHTVE